MYYHDYKVTKFYLRNANHGEPPQNMPQYPAYGVPDDPAEFMTASQMRDVINIAEHVAFHVRPPEPPVLEWWMKLNGIDLLIHLEDPNDLNDG